MKLFPIIPSVGRIVHFVMPDGQHRPAVIVRVWHHPDQAATPDSLVNLQVFTDGPNDDPGRDPAAPLIIWKTSVHQEVAEVLTPGSWHAPELAAERLLELAADIQELSVEHIGIPRADVEAMREKALALCHHIETCGASPELTQASVMAAELNQWFQGLLVPETIAQPLPTGEA